MTILSIPALSAIDYAVSSLSCTASKAECNALTRAQYQIHRGVEIVSITGAFLVPSASRATPYTVDNVTGCNCAAGLAGRACWHVAALSIIIEARNARPTMPRLSKHIAEQAKDAYRAAALPPSARPLFAERDAEDMRRAALAEERAVLIEQRAARAKAIADAFNQEVYP